MTCNPLASVEAEFIAVQLVLASESNQLLVKGGMFYIQIRKPMREPVQKVSCLSPNKWRPESPDSFAYAKHLPSMEG